MYTANQWGRLSDGRAVDLITLAGPGGAVAEISNYGGIIRSITLPMGDGSERQVVLGYETPGEYEADTASIGVTVGPYANRIAGGAFTLEGTAYHLDKNEGDNTLHSGPTGFQNQVFSHRQDGEDGVLLSYRRPDGQGGFPGNLDVTVRFHWRAPMALEITYTAETDRATVVSMTHHSYFNLGPGGPATEHRLKLHADAYTPVDGAQLPTGEIAPVAGTPFDFTEMRTIGRAYDHNFVLRGEGLAAELESTDGKLSMAVSTDMPAVQLYTGTHLETPFQAFGGVCLETQHFPDAPNIPAFPSPVVEPGQTWRSSTTFAFSVK